MRTLVLRPEVPAEPDGVIDIPSTPPSAIVVVVVEEDSPREDRRDEDADSVPPDLDGTTKGIKVKSREFLNSKDSFYLPAIIKKAIRIGININDAFAFERG